MKYNNIKKWSLSPILTITLRCQAIFLFAVVLAFYLYTLAPSVVWADGTRLQMDVILGGSHYLHSDEFSQISTDGWPFDRMGVMPWDHPLYVMIGQVFLSLPLGDLPFRLNLMSALAAAITVSLVYKVGLLLVGSRAAAALGALALAVSHTFWFHAVTTEVYTLHALFMISIIYLVLRWQHHKHRRELKLLALLAGLGLANHVMLLLMLLPVLPYIIVLATVKKNTTASPSFRLPTQRQSSGNVMVFAVLFLIGFAPWWIQFIRISCAFGVEPALESVFSFPRMPYMLYSYSWWTIPTNIFTYMSFLLYQFTPVGFALGIYGIFKLWRTGKSQIAFLLLTLFLLHTLFSANYPVADRFAFHLPSYLIFTLFIINGIAHFISSPGVVRVLNKKRVFVGIRTLLLIAILAPIAVYEVTPGIVRHVGLTASDIGAYPIGTGARDSLAYFLNPNKRGDDSAKCFGLSTMKRLAPDSLIFAPRYGDIETYLVLRYFQVVEGLRPDVYVEAFIFEDPEVVYRAVLEQARSQVWRRPIYLASLNPKLYPLTELKTEFDIMPEANLYRLLPRKPQTVAATSLGDN